MTAHHAAQDGDGAAPADTRVELVVITGYSGAGKSEAIAAFEDGGYFCVDNLPPRMIGGLGELFQHEGSGVQKAAVVTDVRGGYVQAIGGNVKDSVTMSLYPVDSRGRLRPAPGKTWFMVVEKRA